MGCGWHRFRPYKYPFGTALFGKWRKEKDNYAKYISLTCLTLPARPSLPPSTNFPHQFIVITPHLAPPSPLFSSLDTIPRLHSFPLRAACPSSVSSLPLSLPWLVSSCFVFPSFPRSHPAFLSPFPFLPKPLTFPFLLFLIYFYFLFIEKKMLLFRLCWYIFFSYPVHFVFFSFHVSLF